jgi:cytochrome P450 / NADPH-cytochrome P450 reductase
LQKEAPVFVCGEASRMAPDVKQAFVDLFCEHTGASVADGKAWLAGLVTSHRYLEDIWASSVPVSMHVAEPTASPARGVTIGSKVASSSPL